MGTDLRTKFLSDTFSGHGNMHRQLFFLQQFKMLFHYFLFHFFALPSWFLMRKLHLNYWFLMCCFHLAFSRFFAFSFCSLWWVSAWLSWSLSYLKFDELLASANICSFIKSGNFSAIISSNKFLHHFFLLTFQGYNNIQVRSSDTVPQFFEALCLFYQTFFLLCFPDWIIFIDLPSSLLILFFLISILLWWSYSGLSILVSIHSKFPFGSYHFCFLPENFYLSIFKRFSLIPCTSL